MRARTHSCMHAHTTTHTYTHTHTQTHTLQRSLCFNMNKWIVTQLEYITAIPLLIVDLCDMKLKMLTNVLERFRCKCTSVPESHLSMRERERPSLFQ